MMSNTPLLVLCFVISFVGALTDIRYGSVRNAHLAICTVIGTTIAVILVLNGKHPWPTVREWVINLSMAIALGVIFYISDVWAPGDSKLFILIAALYPRQYYAARPGDVFPSLSFVIFAYAVGYIYLLIMSWRSKALKHRQAWLPRLSRPLFISIAINIGIITGLQTAIAYLVPSFAETNQVLILLISVGCCYILQKKWRNLALLLGSLGFITAATATLLAEDWGPLLFSVPVSMLLALITQFMIAMASANNYREIPGEQVRPGMILSFGTILAMQNCIDPDIPHETTENRRSRISPSQAEAVQKWCRITGNNIAIVEMLPFAPFFFAALVIELCRCILLN